MAEGELDALLSTCIGAQLAQTTRTLWSSYPGGVNWLGACETRDTVARGEPRTQVKEKRNEETKHSRELCSGIPCPCLRYSNAAVLSPPAPDPAPAYRSLHAALCAGVTIAGMGAAPADVVDACAPYVVALALAPAPTSPYAADPTASQRSSSATTGDADDDAGDEYPRSSAGELLAAECAYPRPPPMPMPMLMPARRIRLIRPMGLNLTGMALLQTSVVHSFYLYVNQCTSYTQDFGMADHLCNEMKAR